MSHKQPDALSSSESEFLPFAKPCISEAAIAAVVDCLRSGWVTTGPRVQQFEQDLQAYLGAPNVLAVSSGTAGLYMSLMAMGIGPGDEVITTSLTFVATLNTIVLTGAKPVLVDVDPKTYNMDLNQVEKAITSRTRAILPVHFAGLPVDMYRLYDLANTHHLRVVEDAAHAIGSEFHGKKIGGFGDVQIFSFHPNKNITTGEGGAIAVHDPDLVPKLQALRFHGMNKLAWDRFTKKGSQHYDVVAPAHKFNMMDLQAALGIHQLKALDDFITQRTQLAERYVDALADCPHLELPPQSSHASVKHNWHLFAPTLQENAPITRDELMRCLKEDYHIGTGLHYTPPHLYTYYQETFGFRKGDFPMAEKIGDNILSLPLFPGMSQTSQDRVLKAFKNVWSI